MNRPPSNAPTRLAGLLVLTMTLGGCGLLAGPSESETIATLLERSAQTQTILDRAVNLATTTGQTMSAEFHANAEQLETAITEFNETADELEENSLLDTAAESYAQAANLVTGLLTDGTIDVAAEVMRTQAAPKYDTLRDQLLARQTELGGPDSGGGGWLLPVLVIVAAGFGGYIYVLRRRPTLAEKLATPKTVPPAAKSAGSAAPTPQPTEEPAEETEEESFTSSITGLPLPPEIGKHDVAPTPAPAPPEPTGPVRNPEALHSVRGGLRTVELRGIIDAALETVVDAGWEVAIECPDVHVLVDPLRMRRLLSNLLLSATAHGAEHIGLVAIIVGDKVEINVGHDGSLLKGIADTDTTSPPEVDHQLTVARQLLGGMHANVRWTNWRGVSLYTIELVRGPDESVATDERVAASAD